MDINNGPKNKDNLITNNQAIILLPTRKLYIITKKTAQSKAADLLTANSNDTIKNQWHLVNNISKPQLPQRLEFFHYSNFHLKPYYLHPLHTNPFKYLAYPILGASASRARNNII